MTVNHDPSNIGASPTNGADRDQLGAPKPTWLDICVGRSSVVRLCGELDIDSAPRLAAILDALARPGRTIELDVTELMFIDSSGARVLCRTVEQLGRHGRLVLSRPTTAVRRVLELTGVISLIEISSTPHGSTY